MRVVQFCVAPGERETATFKLEREVQVEVEGLWKRP